MRVPCPGSGRVDAGLHRERPPVGLAMLVAELKPRRHSDTVGRQRHRFHIGLVKVVMNPVGVAVKILHRVKRSTQRDQRESIPRAIIGRKLVVAGNELLRVLKQAVEQVIEIRVALEITVQVIEVEENRRATKLGIVGLIQRRQSPGVRALGRSFRHRAEKIRGEVAELHDLPRTLGKTELLASPLDALLMPVGIEAGGRRHDQHSYGQQNRDSPRRRVRKRSQAGHRISWFLEYTWSAPGYQHSTSMRSDTQEGQRRVKDRREQTFYRVYS